MVCAGSELVLRRKVTPNSGVIVRCCGAVIRRAVTESCEEHRGSLKDSIDPFYQLHPRFWETPLAPNQGIAARSSRSSEAAHDLLKIPAARLPRDPFRRAHRALREAAPR